jgi:hypothetical protein
VQYDHIYLCMLINLKTLLVVCSLVNNNVYCTRFSLLPSSFIVCDCGTLSKNKGNNTNNIIRPRTSDQYDYCDECNIIRQIRFTLDVGYARDIQKH